MNEPGEALPSLKGKVRGPEIFVGDGPVPDFEKTRGTEGDEVGHKKEPENPPVPQEKGRVDDGQQRKDEDAHSLDEQGKNESGDKEKLEPARIPASSQTIEAGDDGEVERVLLIRSKEVLEEYGRENEGKDGRPAQSAAAVKADQLENKK